MTAKTRSQDGGTDRSGAAPQGALTTSTGFSRKRQKPGSKRQKTEGASKLSKVIESMFKYRESQKALDEALEDECVAEEKIFGGPPDRPVSHPFEEIQFGDVVKHDVYRHFPCSVVSIALFDGDTKLFACSGILLPRPSKRAKLDLTRYVTSARLATEYKDNRYRDDKLRIEVRLPNGEKLGGLLELYNRHIAIVTLLGQQSGHPVDLELQTGCPYFDGEVEVAGRAFGSGCLMSAKVELVPGSVDMSWCFQVNLEVDLPIDVDPERISVWKLVHDYKETWQYPAALLGGPVLGEDNRFIGMSIDIGCHCPNDCTYVSFLPLPVLCRYLKHFRILNPKELHFRGYLLPDRVDTLVPSGFMRRINRIKHYGYPMPPPLMLELNGVLRNQFEECFGEPLAWKGYPFPVLRHNILGVWKQIPKDVVKNLSRRVVSIASFHGHVRYFACTGLLIKWHRRTVVLTSASLVRRFDNENEIDNSLKIEVFLPPKQRAHGKLELYNLNYNISILSIQKKFISVCPEDISNKSSMPKLSGKVVAVGREPQQGLLIASIGEVKRRDKDCKLDCKDLMLSTCKAKKAAIGGPLINFDGSFVGMNFFDGRMLTPFLPRSKIVQVLGSKINLPLPSERWPVPEPYWYHGLLDVDWAEHKHIGRKLH